MASSLEFGYVDHSWTKRELKEECGVRGLTHIGRLNKEDLIQVLNDGMHKVGPFDNFLCFGSHVRRGHTSFFLFSAPFSVALK